MKLAVISDVHANLEALSAVIDDARRHEAGAIVCLGDLVGYHASPRETLTLLRDAGVRSVQGNHDLMAVGRLEPDRCGPNARRAIEWTRQILDEGDREYLQALPPKMLLDSSTLLLHSALGDPCVYLRSAEQYEAQVRAIRAEHPAVRIVLTGHTHTGAVVDADRSGRAHILGRVRHRLDPERFYFLNPGSVGHPRREDYRASYLIYDEETRLVTFRKVPYDRERVRQVDARNAIHTDFGPAVLAHRLRGMRTLVRRIARRAARTLAGAASPTPR